MAATTPASDLAVQHLVSARLQRARAEHGLVFPWPTLASEQFEIAAQEAHALALGQGSTLDDEVPTEGRRELLELAERYRAAAVRARQEENETEVSGLALAA